MTGRDHEEDQLRAVALRNAQSMLAARQHDEQDLRKQSEWLRVTLASIGDAVISTDAEGRVTFMNRSAEALTGWPEAEGLGQSLPDVFHIVNERTRQPVESPALRALHEGTIVGLANHTVLIARDGSERPIDDSAAPMRDEAGLLLGTVLVFRDVSERKRAEEVRARLAAIVESSEDAIVSKTLDGVIRSWNAAAVRLFGYTPEEAVGRSITLIIPPDRLAEEDHILQQLRRGERIEHFETVRMAKDGRLLDISLTVSPIRDTAGVVIGASKIARDVTERKRIEGERAAAAQALAESRALLDYAVRLSGVGFWHCDMPFDVLVWDERVKEHFWLPADAHVTIETFYQRLHPDDREPTRQAIEAALRDRTPCDLIYRTVDSPTGAVKWVRALGAATFAADGTPTRFDGVTVDVTNQKLDEARLAAALEREREQGRLLRRVADAALTVHSAGTLDSVLRVVAEEARRILGAHQAACSLTAGNDWSQAVSTVVLSEKYARWHGYEVRPTGAGIYSLVCRTNRPVRLTQAELEAHPEWRNFSGEAEHHPPLRGWLAAPFVSRGGKNLGLIQLSDKEGGDFTESDEAVLVQLAHVASVAIENARLYDALREQDRRKDEFLALLAHELRNPLAPLSNGLQVMRLAESDRSAVARARGMMERQLGHMVRLIDDLLDVSRINCNKMELRRSRVLLADMVSSAVETVRPAIEAAEHELTISLPPAPVRLDADLTRLAQVLGNLLGNSAKYTPHGGHIWLTARVEGARSFSRPGDGGRPPTRLEESSERSAPPAALTPVAVISVRDDGIGIPAESLPNIFDMFSQVDRSIERSTGGLGIGLALVKGLVEMHGGTVAAESPGVGKGSTFTIRLPVLAAAEPALEATGGEGTRAAGPRRRILVVDDNRDSGASMAMMLRLLNNEVRTAHDGIEAVEAAEAFRPEVILMDVGMPRLNGYDATRRIRERPWGGAVVVIALTGWGQQEDRARSREAGCDGHLVKPVGLPDLERLLAELSERGAP
jgi:PAS domain S-box-containing protein